MINHSNRNNLSGSHENKIEQKNLDSKEYILCVRGMPLVWNATKDKSKPWRSHHANGFPGGNKFFFFMPSSYNTDITSFTLRRKLLQFAFNDLRVNVPPTLRTTSQVAFINHDSYNPLHLCPLPPAVGTSQLLLLLPDWPGVSHTSRLFPQPILAYNVGFYTIPYLHSFSFSQLFWHSGSSDFMAFAVTSSIFLMET